MNIPMDFVFKDTAAVPDAINLGMLAWWVPLDGSNLFDGRRFLILLGQLMDDEARLEC